MIAERDFLNDEDAVAHEIGLVEECRTLLGRVDLPHRDNFPPIAAVVSELSDVNSMPSPLDLYTVARYLSSMHTLAERFCAYTLADSNKSALALLLKEMPDLSSLSDRILEVIDEEGELIIVKISELDALQKRRVEAARAVEEELKSTHRHNANYYQSPIPVVRNNRFCLALNADFIGKVKAAVIDQSASGETLFVEPISCITLNNRWMQYTQLFQHECHAFIMRLVDAMKEACTEIERALGKFTFIDSLLARAQFARDFDCYTAKIAAHHISLYRARHPLLGDSAIPIDIHTEDGCYVTVIGGANGGGKTVTLKTVGMMVLMHYFGMQIPAAEGSYIPRCRDVMLIIGDEQSIHMQRSSFTAQMEHINSSIARADQESLVLFDELAGNTDPEEGAALATAIASYMVDKKAHTFITTHFTQLKEYAVNNEHSQLLSMEYNERQHKPRFTIISGLAEGSHALDVAREVGLDETIIAHAMRLLNSDAVEYKRMLKTLLVQQQECDSEREDLKRLQQSLHKKEAELQKREDTMHTKYIAEIEKLISSSRQKLERLIAEVRKKNIALPTKDIHSQMKTTNMTLSQKATDMREQITDQKRDAKSAAHFRIGDRVLLDEHTTPLEISAIIDEDTIEVARGKLRMKVRPSRLRHAAAGGRAAEGAAEGAIEENTSPTAIYPHASAPDYKSTIDVRGKYAHEIETILLQQINDGCYNNATEFSIIHGIGSGALQKEVARVLNTQRTIVSSRYALPHDGGRGKTIVTFINPSA